MLLATSSIHAKFLTRQHGTGFTIAAKENTLSVGAISLQTLSLSVLWTPFKLFMAFCKKKLPQILFVWPVKLTQTVDNIVFVQILGKDEYPKHFFNHILDT